MGEIKTMDEPKTCKATSTWKPREVKRIAEDSSEFGKYRCYHCQETFYCDNYPIDYCPMCGERKPKELSSDWHGRLERTVYAKED